MQEIKRLAKSEIQDLNKQGHKLDEEGFYVIRFLFNDKWNKAQQPNPFRVKTELLDKLAQDAIGMPWIVPPYGVSQHPTELEQIIEATKKYTIGTIRSTIRYPSNNVFGIIEILPQFQGAIENNLIPPLVSPLLNIVKHDNFEVEDAQFLNLQSVPTSGYAAELTQISSVCKAGIKQCMEELAVVGATGHDTSRFDTKSFSNRQNGLPSSMSAQDEITLEGVAKQVADHSKILGEHSKSLDQIVTDVATIKNAVGQKPQPQGQPAGAAGPESSKQAKQITIPPELKDNEFVKTILEKSEAQEQLLKKINEEREAEKKKALEQKRKSAAESIVSILIKNKKIDEKNKDAEIKKYLDLKNEDGAPTDLDAIEATLKSVLPEEAEDKPEIAGAYGYYAPNLKGDSTQKRSNAELLGMS
jgi:hypothetical protein